MADMPKEQKVVAAFLLLLGATALVLGFAQMRQGIALGIQKSKSQIAGSQLQITESFEGSSLGGMIPLKAKDDKDTDKDGLSDYDELYVYKTSPYLSDSDSDSYSDKKEIDSKHDPNCPVGQVCRQLPDLEPETDSFLALKSGSLAGNLASNTPGVQDIRQILASQGGLSPELLAQISDEELLEAWQTTLGGEVSPLKTNTENTEISVNQRQEISGQMPTAEEIRGFLKSEGLSEAILKNISDDELLRLFEESMKQVQ